MSMTSSNLKSEVLVGPERRRHRTPAEKFRPSFELRAKVSCPFRSSILRSDVQRAEQLLIPFRADTKQGSPGSKTATFRCLRTPCC